MNACDLIAIFCGGVLEVNNILGEIYRFDEQNKIKCLMKCPPFGYISRDSMCFHYDYNWLMFAIRECKLKADIDNRLMKSFDEIMHTIKNSITPIGGSYEIFQTFWSVIKFINFYNSMK